MDYNKKKKSGIMNIFIIIITLFIIQFIFLDSYLKRSFVDGVISSAFYTQESNDIKMIERYFEMYREEMGNPVLLSVYSFIYSTQGFYGSSVKGGNVPLVLAYEPRYNWNYDKQINIPVINVEKNNNIYIIPEGGEHIKKLLRGDLLEIKIEDVNEKRLTKPTSNRLNKIIAIPIISEYKLKGFVILGWEVTMDNSPELIGAIQKFGDAIRPYIDYKLLQQSDIININKGSQTINVEKEK